MMSQEALRELCEAHGALVDTVDRGALPVEVAQAATTYVSALRGYWAARRRDRAAAGVVTRAPEAYAHGHVRGGADGPDPG
jgi:hypothetical protein